MDPVWHCDHLAGEERVCVFVFLWFVACVLPVTVCSLIERLRSVIVILPGHLLSSILFFLLNKLLKSNQSYRFLILICSAFPKDPNAERFDLAFKRPTRGDGFNFIFIPDLKKEIIGKLKCHLLISEFSR